MGLAEESVSRVTESCCRHGSVGRVSQAKLREIISPKDTDQLSSMSSMIGLNFTNHGSKEVWLNTECKPSAMSHANVRKRLHHRVQK